MLFLIGVAIGAWASGRINWPRGLRANGGRP